jgi:hypothetical protein
MTRLISTGYFDGSNSGVPYQWGTDGSWFINGTSATGYPGAGDIAGIGLATNNLGYVVQVTTPPLGTLPYSTGDVSFLYNSVAPVTDYLQDAVLQVMGPNASLTLTGTAVGSSVQSLTGNSASDAYVNISQGGTLEVDSLASKSVSVFFGTYSNAYDGSAPTIDSSGSNTDELLIGAPGATGYNYTNGSFGSPIYGLIGADKVVFGQIAYNAGDTMSFSPGGSSGLTGTHALLESTFGIPGTLSIFNPSGTKIASLTIAQPTDTSTFRLANVGGDLAVSDACFLSGTRILTEHGEVAVEDLREGDGVITLDGEKLVVRPVRWIGHRQIDLAVHPKPETMTPIRIRRDAVADNVPHRDLLVSPDHAIFLGGKLIPARMLVNGATIVEENGARTVRYFHVELDRHAVLVAEGLPAESYLDTGNRGFFANAELATVLHPDLSVSAARLGVWERDACAPLSTAEWEVRPVWERLAARAAALGHAVALPATTSDAALRLVVDGRALRPIAVTARRYVFPLPRGARSVRLASRSGSPAESRPWLDDRRRLGVFVERIVVQSEAGVEEIPLDHPSMMRGWHRVEQQEGQLRRWTNGDATIVVPPSAAEHGGVLEVGVRGVMHYAAGGRARAA